MNAAPPLEARLLAAAAPHLPAEARAALAAGHVGARVVRAALAEVAATRPLGVTLTRSEATRALAWLGRADSIPTAA